MVRNIKKRGITKKKLGIIFPGGGGGAGLEQGVGKYEIKRKKKLGGLMILKE